MKRRSFLQSLGVIVTGCYLALKVELPVEKPKRPDTYESDTRAFFAGFAEDDTLVFVRASDLYRP